ncbi:polymer-forming cytoskeletal protein [Variovorax dokdonensis]|uniref:Polymer-forming cytoskeletal protein n=1 Tax=Variovorax dokdonensis TaxID=344883 RepID=A0ABT7N7K4_9BURK|nr:polymer-forming cytoskeletal protein [Variovorax dokdonensis]MDM0043908.1 polymer-forming cytoskeletal protein [Variovorax dokdonensis]
MQQQRIEGRWIAAFEAQFRRCAVGAGDLVAILSETQSRALNVHLAELALLSIGARPFHVVLPTPPQTEQVPVRSTGASDVIGEHGAVIAGLSAAQVVVDCTVEGLLHARELKQILSGGARLVMISNEHPEILERVAGTPGLEAAVRRGRELLSDARKMQVTSAAGTELSVDLVGAVVGGNWGYCTEPGTRTHWPGGLVACVPASGATHGKIVLAPGDVNLTFKRYLESPITLHIEADYVTRIEGSGLDAELMRSYFEAWGDRNAYAVSHVGWGMNPRARWDALTMYDRNDVNGTELRVFAGNFLFSTGANENAGRFTKGHFDIPMRACSITVDGRPVVTDGQLSSDMKANLQ